MLLVFETKILVETVALLLNVAVTSDSINLVIIAVGRICVDFNCAKLVDKTAKVIDIVSGIGQRIKYTLLLQWKELIPSLF